MYSPKQLDLLKHILIINKKLHNMFITDKLCLLLHLQILADIGLYSH